MAFFDSRCRNNYSKVPSDLPSCDSLRTAVPTAANRILWQCFRQTDWCKGSRTSSPQDTVHDSIDVITHNGSKTHPFHCCKGMAIVGQFSKFLADILYEICDNRVCW